MTYPSDIVIQNVAFRGEDVIEITYSEQREMTDQATMIRAIIFDRDTASVQVDELVDAAREAVDAALSAMRRVPDSRPSGLSHRRE